MSASSSSRILFGGDLGWHSEDWTASDDRVRGGSSQSYLECNLRSARFHGILDTKTLGGAGFASQHTTGDDRELNLSSFDGIQLVLDTNGSDQKKYTFILKDQLLPPDPESGREQATISWESTFDINSAFDQSENIDSPAVIFIPWKDFVPTYRGKKKEDAGKIDLHRIKRVSVMMRSFFGTQEGEFSLVLHTISATMKHAPGSGRASQGKPESINEPSSPTEPTTTTDPNSGKLQNTNESTFWAWLFGKT